MVRAFLVVLVLLGATSSAMADGIEDLAGCKAATGRDAGGRDAGFCMGIVEGLMWSLPGWGIVCLPKGVTTGQGLKALVKYMDDHPEELHDRTAGSGPLLKNGRALDKRLHDSETPTRRVFLA